MHYSFRQLSNYVAIFVLFFGLHTGLIGQVDKIHIEYERISDRVLVVWGGKIYKDQVVAITTEKGIVLIDAGKAPTLTREYRKIIERESGRNDFTYVINTHYHFDHTSGNQVFPEAAIIAHQKTPALMKNWTDNRQAFVDGRRANQLPQWISQRDAAEPGSEEWERFNDFVTTQIVMFDDYENNYILTLPEITFNDRMTLDLGDITLKLYYWGEGLHTGDDILIYCPEEKLLFSGDLFFKGALAISYVPSFDEERQIKILDDIFENENNVKWVYDCHNGRMTGEFIYLFHRYMKDIWNKLSEVKNKGMDLNSILNDYSYGKEFSYIVNSGIDKESLNRGHADNLKFTWYSINNTKSAAGELEKIINEKGIKFALLKFDEIKSLPEINYFFAENEFNQLGYALLSAGKIKEAIEIFKINVEKFPGSGNAYDSLGEAYLNNGQKELALKNYEKALELNPNNSNASQVIKNLRERK